MDTPCVLISSCGEYPAQRLIQDILDVECLPDSKPEVEDIVSYDWSIETKYYTADIKLCMTNKRTIGNREFADSVQAFIVYFDTDQKDTFSAVKLWSSYLKEIDPEIKMLVCDRCSDNAVVGRMEALNWCIENGFELVELNPEILSDGDTEDDFVETTGLKRIVQSLHAHTWPNMDLKDNRHSMSPFIRQLMKEEHEEQQKQASNTSNGTSDISTDNDTTDCDCEKDKKNQLNEKELSESKTSSQSSEQSSELSNSCQHCVDSSQVETEGACGGSGSDSKTKKTKHNNNKPSKEARLDALLPPDDVALFEALGNDDPGGESFEKMFEKFAQLKDKANSLPATERKKYAENVAIAFWKAMGGDEDEIGDLDSD